MLGLDGRAVVRVRKSEGLWKSRGTVLSYHVGPVEWALLFRLRVKQAPLSSEPSHWPVINIYTTYIFVMLFGYWVKWLGLGAGSDPEKSSWTMDTNKFVSKGVQKVL